MGDLSDSAGGGGQISHRKNGIPGKVTAGNVGGMSQEVLDQRLGSVGYNPNVSHL